MAPANEKNRWFITLLLPIVIALLGLAASWGAASSEAATTHVMITEIKQEQKENNYRVRALELAEARDEEIFKSILKELQKIDRKLDNSMCEKR